MSSSAIMGMPMVRTSRFVDSNWGFPTTKVFKTRSRRLTPTILLDLYEIANYCYCQRSSLSLEAHTPPKTPRGRHCTKVSPVTCKHVKKAETWSQIYSFDPDFLRSQGPICQVASNCASTLEALLKSTEQDVLLQTKP